MKQSSLCLRATLAIVLLVGVHGSAKLEAQEAGATMLQGGESTERFDRLAARSIATRSPSRRAGEYVNVIVEQRGIDVSIQIRGVDGSVLADFDDEITSTGQEQPEIVAGASGTYTLAIKPAAGMIKPGAYAIPRGQPPPRRRRPTARWPSRGA